MADPLEILMDVQGHDTAIDQLRQRIRNLPERAALADVEQSQLALGAQRAELAARISAVAARQEEIEEQIAASAQRRHAIEERMQSGTASSRDLEAMDHEVSQLTTRQAALEDDEMLLLEEQEPLDAALATLSERSADLEAKAAELKVLISEADAELGHGLAQQEEARARSAADLPPELAERYERLRSKLGGVGAARLVGDRCEGCHLSLPSVEIERIRALPLGELATCPQCDRLLVH